MSCNWIEIPLGDFIEFKRGYDLPKSKRLVGQVPIVSSAGISDYHSEPKVEGPGVVTGRYGTIGEIFYIEEDFWPLNTTLYVTDFKGNYPELVYYLLKTFDFHKYSDKAAVPGVNRNHLHMEKIRVPQNVFWQEKLAKYLSKLDRKIVLNTQINQTLEEMAQAIFKSWFVDFDPVKAKMNGEQPEGMDEATASLFPEKLVESELGLIPYGWEAVKVGDIVERLKPKKRYTKKQVEPYGKTPVYEQGASILLGFHNDEAGFNASPEEPIFIFGDHTCITYLSCSEFDISSNVIPLKGSIRPTIWTYYSIQGKQEFQEYRRHWSEFIVKNAVLPPSELTQKFAEIVTTNYLMMESLKRQSKQLEQVRDTLLPKLLSGEIELGSVATE
jgi:type I restriction enzyme, S subunit